MPFVKGQSGNPKGAPKKEYTFTKCFEQAVDKLEVDTKDKGKIKGKEVVVQAYLDLAFNSKYPPAIRQRALDTIVERIDGKARQTVDLGGEITTENKPLISHLDVTKMTKEEKAEMERLLEKTVK